MKIALLGAAIGLAALVFGCTTPAPWVAEAIPSSETDTYRFSGELVVASDKQALQSYSWVPVQTTAPVGVVVVVHGLKDHARRYQALAESLTGSGFVVLASDLRGHGASSGDRQRFDSIPQLVDDVNLLVTTAQATWPNTPVYLYGHSLGGLVAASYAQKYSQKLAGLVLSAPALKLLPDVSGVTIGFARLIASIAPGANIQAMDERQFVQSPDAFAAMQADRLIFHDSLPARSAVATVDGIEELAKQFGQTSLPLLVVHGTADVVTNQIASKEYVAASPSVDKIFEAIPGAWHDLLHEPQAPELIKMVVGWLSQRATK